MFYMFSVLRSDVPGVCGAWARLAHRLIPAMARSAQDTVLDRRCDTSRHARESYVLC